MAMQGNNIDINDILDALDSVTWYNSLAGEIQKWKFLPVNGGLIQSPLSLQSGMPEGMRKQLEVFWIISVTLFGDYGVSPRVGWIEDTDGFYDFIDKITETYINKDD